MANKEYTPEEENLIEAEEIQAGDFTATESFMQRNRNTVYIGAAALLVVVMGVVAYFTMYQGPREAKASDALHQAQALFERDSFQAALVGRPGPTGFPGLLDVIDNYSGTAAGNLAYYYAGASFLHMGEFDKAIQWLEKFSGSDKLSQGMAYGMLGDAHSEKGNFDEALSYYEKAANYEQNKVTSPYFLRKAGLLSEKQGNTEKARELYKSIETDYPGSSLAGTIVKDLMRVGGTPN